MRLWNVTGPLALAGGGVASLEVSTWLESYWLLATGISALAWCALWTLGPRGSAAAMSAGA